MAESNTRKISPAPAEEPAYDFDSWSDEAEEKAIAALVPNIRYIIVERDFIGRFSDGVTVRMPLSISLDDVDALQEESASPVDQFKKLLSSVGGDAVARQFSSHDLVETSVLAEKYFTVLQKVTKASLPE